jgi:hypothetical protein
MMFSSSFFLSELMSVEVPFCNASKGDMLSSKVCFSLPECVDTAQKQAVYLSSNLGST